MKCLFFRIAAAGAVLFFPIVSFSGQIMEEITREKILAYGQDWQEKYDQYALEADIVDALKAKLGAQVKIDIYLGLWCPDSRNNVPPFIKILDRLATGSPVRYFSLPRKASKETKYYVEELRVERVPTFIIYREGKEIGRIIENPKTGLIEDFMEIVFK